MSAWTERILNEFTADLARLWIVADPDAVLLDEQLLCGLRERGFEVLRFEDSVAFRAEYEERYRAVWDQGQAALSSALILHLRDANVSDLPWDYLCRARKLSLSLAELFPRLSYRVLRQLGGETLEPLFDAQARHAHQALGEAASKAFVLTHIFRLSPHSMTRSEDLWRELLRLHYRDVKLPFSLALHVQRVLGEHSAFKGLPIAALFAQKSLTLRVVQDAWRRYLNRRGLAGARTAEPSPEYVPKTEVPFEHRDVRAILGSMFLDGTLRPPTLAGELSTLPDWAKAWVIRDPGSMRKRVLEGIDKLLAEMPTIESSHRHWRRFSRRLGELVSRAHRLDSARAESIEGALHGLLLSADEGLRKWVGRHYADLPSLPAARGPLMVHHVPRYLAMRREAGEEKLALVVFDGLAVDQWTQIRESVMDKSRRLVFDEDTCFAWLPSLTSVSRQALFSGLRPRQFADSIETTAREPSLWTRFWQDHGLRAGEVLYRKSIKRTDDLPALAAALNNPGIKVAGLVVDTIDEIIHGAVLGKRGVSAQIASWCESGFVDRLFALLLDNDFHVYLSADHGNVEAVGIGRPNQGVAAELRGERVRTYRSEALIAAAQSANPEVFRLNIAGLPANFMPLFTAGRGAFVPRGEQLVVHGGVSVEELLVPFVKVSYAR